MKKIITVFAAAITLAVWGQGTESPASTNGALPALTVTNGTGLSPEDRAQYADLIREEIESSTQLNVLTTLADEQRKRSEESRHAGDLAKSEWQAALGREFHDQSSLVLGRLNGATKRRLVFEADHGERPSPAADLGRLQAAKALTVNELAYVTKLDERQLKVRQALAICDEVTQSLYTQLVTNTNPGAVAEVSRIIDLNTKQAQQFEREEADIELRKLEFRALRR